MAKKGGKSSGAVSQGIHSNVSRSLTNSMRRDYMVSAERIVNQHAAWRKGKNVVLKIENPNKEEVNKPFLYVNAKEVWGDAKRNT